MFSMFNQKQKEQVSAEVWGGCVDNVHPVVVQVEHLLNSESVNAIFKFLMKVKNEVRIHLLPYGENSRLLWEMISEDSAVMDFVLEGTSTLLAHSLLYQDSMDRMITQLAHTLTINNVRGSVIPVEIREQMPTQGDTVSLLQTNPWVIFIVAIKMNYELDGYISAKYAELVAGVGND